VVVHYSATIDWGDNSRIATGGITDNGDGTYDMAASHTYLAAGSYTATVTVADNRTPGRTATAATTVNVSGPPAPPGGNGASDHGAAVLLARAAAPRAARVSPVGHLPRVSGRTGGDASVSAVIPALQSLNPNATAEFRSLAVALPSASVDATHPARLGDGSQGAAAQTVSGAEYRGVVASLSAQQAVAVLPSHDAGAVPPGNTSSPGHRLTHAGPLRSLDQWNPAVLGLLAANLLAES
jgi:PKD repeat protein